jgi:hypothetical protein
MCLSGIQVKLAICEVCHKTRLWVKRHAVCKLASSTQGWIIVVTRSREENWQAF